jgi:hypothetical protein
MASISIPSSPPPEYQGEVASDITDSPNSLRQGSAWTIGHARSLFSFLPTDFPRAAGSIASFLTANVTAELIRNTVIVVTGGTGALMIAAGVKDLSHDSNAVGQIVGGGTLLFAAGFGAGISNCLLRSDRQHPQIEEIGLL